MKLVIPCFNFDATILRDQIKQVAVCLKSYYYHGNTMEVVIPTNSNLVVNVIHTLSVKEQWNVSPWYVSEDISRYSDYLNTKRPQITSSKLYCLFQVHTDDDIFICDYDTMFTSYVEWESLRGESIKAFIHPSWEDKNNVTIHNMLTFSAYENGINISEYIDSVCNSLNWDKSRLDSYWINGGIIFFSSNYRKTKLVELCNIMKHDAFSIFTVSEEERLYAHLWMIHSPDLECVESSLNVAAMFYRNDISDVFSIPDVSMVHFQRKPKPHQYTITPDGILKEVNPSPVWDIHYYGTRLTLLASSDINCILFTTLWQYFYALIQHQLHPYIKLEFVHAPETYMNVFNQYKISHDIWVNLLKK